MKWVKHLGNEEMRNIFVHGTSKPRLEDQRRDGNITLKLIFGT